MPIVQRTITCTSLDFNHPTRTLLANQLVGEGVFDHSIHNFRIVCVGANTYSRVPRQCIGNNAAYAPLKSVPGKWSHSIRGGAARDGDLCIHFMQTSCCTPTHPNVCQINVCGHPSSHNRRWCSIQWSSPIYAIERLVTCVSPEIAIYLV